MILHANGNVSMLTANSTLFIGNTAISNAGISVGGAAINPFGGMRNRIINGAMVIDQRYAGAANTPGEGVYVVDRWAGRAVSGNPITHQRNMDSLSVPAGYSNYLGANVTTSTALTGSKYHGIQQSIEGYNIVDLGWGTSSARPITISFWVRSSISGTYSVGLWNSGFSRGFAQEYVINSSNTWEYKTITVPGDTSGTWGSVNDNGIIFMFNLGSCGTFATSSPGVWGSGTTGTTNPSTWLTTSAARFYITGVQIEAGTVATPFEFRYYGQELALCQRYYQKSYDIGTIPGTATFIGMVGFPVYGGGSCLHYVPYRVSMRPGGSVSFWDAAGNANKLSNFNGNTWANNTGTNAATYVGENNWGLNYGVGAANPWITGQPALIHFAASAEL